MAEIGDQTTTRAVLASWVLGIAGIVTGLVLGRRKESRRWGVGLAMGFGLGSVIEAIVFVCYLAWLGNHTS
ncbi:hypothetical protein [Nocardioides aquiterrae]|uniref:DUF4190 domain-containing protein n=1 Tax=Nocardioides aquiterrae TaxID=203799 RepID=A0ABN1UEP2_9ACTN